MNYFKGHIYLQRRYSFFSILFLLITSKIKISIWKEAKFSKQALVHDLFLDLSDKFMFLFNDLYLCIYVTNKKIKYFFITLDERLKWTRNLLSIQKKNRYDSLFRDRVWLLLKKYLKKKKIGESHLFIITDIVCFTLILYKF